MKNIKLYELEETYHGEKSTLEYPTVSYTVDTDKVWYVQPIQISTEVYDWFDTTDEAQEGITYELAYDGAAVQSYILNLVETKGSENVSTWGLTWQGYLINRYDVYDDGDFRLVQGAAEIYVNVTDNTISWKYGDA